MTTLEALCAPRSIAVLGASPDPSRFGTLALRNLRAGGYDGELLAVHPTAAHIDGVPCLPRLADLTAPPDLCIIAVRAEAVLGLLEDCAAAGARSAVVVASGFAGWGTEEGWQVQARMRAIARDAGMRILGPNTIGVANYSRRTLAAASANLPLDLSPGRVAILSQSGGVGTSILAAARRYGLGVGTFLALGNEVDVGAAEAIRHLVAGGASAVLCYLEAIRDPHSFGAAAVAAVEAGVPIVVLNGGRSASGQAVAAAHTAALAGSHQVRQAVLRQWQVLEVSSLDTLVACGLLFDRFGAPPGEAYGVLGLGGGSSALLADQLADSGLPLATIASSTSEAMMKLLPDGNGSNPMDPGGQFLARDPHHFELALAEFASDDAIDILLFGVVPLSPAREDVILAGMGAVAATAGKPVIALGSHTPATPKRSETFDKAGIVELPCNPAGTEALRLWHSWRPAPARERDAARAGRSAAGQRVVLEDEAMSILSGQGFEFPDTVVISGADELAAVAPALSYPVVVKALVPGLSHRSRAGAVALGVTDAAAAEEACDRVRRNATRATERADVRLLIQSQVPQGQEFIVGLQRDPVFGPVVMFGLGGIWSEQLNDVTYALPPLQPADAQAMIRRLRAGTQLARHIDSGDLHEAELVDLLVRMGDLGLAVGPDVRTVELNPVIVGPSGARIADALMVIEEASE